MRYCCLHCSCCMSFRLLACNCGHLTWLLCTAMAFVHLYLLCNAPAACSSLCEDLCCICFQICFQICCCWISCAALVLLRLQWLLPFPFGAMHGLRWVAHPETATPSCFPPCSPILILLALTLAGIAAVAHCGWFHIACKYSYAICYPCLVLLL